MDQSLAQKSPDSLNFSKKRQRGCYLNHQYDTTAPALVVPLHDIATKMPAIASAVPLHTPSIIMPY